MQNTIDDADVKSNELNEVYASYLFAPLMVFPKLKTRRKKAMIMKIAYWKPDPQFTKQT